MVNRRDFLGFVSAFSFFAMLPTEPWQRSQGPFQISFTGPGGLELQAPAVCRIEALDGAFKFVAEPLDLHTAITLDRTSIYYKDQLISTVRFNNTISLIDGDQLRVDQTIRYWGQRGQFQPNFKTPEEMAECILDSNIRKVYD